MPKEKNGTKATGNRALLDVDERIVLALQERDECSRKVSLLVYWQDRLQRVNADIDMLISIQQRLTGKMPEQSIPTLPQMTIPGTGYSHTAAIPANISSVPRQANPAPSGTNVADDVANEGGFQ